MSRLASRPRSRDESVAANTGGTRDKRSGDPSGRGELHEDVGLVLNRCRYPQIMPTNDIRRTT